MSYSTLQAALQAQLEALPELKGRTTLDDATILNKGHPHAAILAYSSFTEAAIAFDSEFQSEWVVDIRLYARYQNDGQVRASMRDLRDAIIDRIRAHRTLGNTAGCLDCQVTSGRRDAEQVEVGAVKYYREIISVRMTEISSVPSED